LLRRVVWKKFSVVSEMLATSIVTDNLTSLMMEAASISETTVNFFQTTRRNNPEDSHLHIRRR
jgi:hypothetical protein